MVIASLTWLALICNNKRAGMYGAGGAGAGYNSYGGSAAAPPQQTFPYGAAQGGGAPYGGGGYGGPPVRSPGGYGGSGGEGHQPITTLGFQGLHACCSTTQDKERVLLLAADECGMHMDVSLGYCIQLAISIPV